MRYIWLGVLLTLTGQAFGAEERFPSGLIKNFYQPSRPSGLRTQSTRSVAKLFALEQFRSLPEGFEWKESGTLRSGKLSHHRFFLYYRGKRVAEKILKVHVHPDGYVWSASSNLKETPAPREADSRAHSAADAEKWVRADYFRRKGSPFMGSFKIEPVIWVNSGTGEAVHAYEIMYGARHPFESRRFFVDEKDLNILAEMRTRRHVNQNAKVWDINPDRTAHVTRTLTDLNAVNTLINSTLHVWRVEQDGTARNVNPSTDFSAEVGFDDTDPNNYNAACTGALATSCPNQGADAVNVYYHVNGFRALLTTYFTALSVSPTLQDPLDVFVNFPIDDGEGGFVANNAFYNSSSCGTGVDRCLIFLYPAPDDAAACGGGFVDFYDLAREANVAVHEYQHYITDQIAGFVASTSSAANVGDVVHEGYSDYFGVSHVMGVAVSNAVATTGAEVVGEYSFQECPYYERDISALRPIEHTTEEGDDPHLGGYSFASGLLDLRSTYGQAIVDKIALQSLFLAPAEPGSIDMVESLVQADELLFSGAHVTEIRDVFYNQIGFVPNGSASFRDDARTIRELGMRSCAAIHVDGDFGGSASLAFLWLFSLLSAGRFVTRRQA